MLKSWNYHLNSPKTLSYMKQISGGKKHHTKQQHSRTQTQHVKGEETYLLSTKGRSFGSSYPKVHNPWTLVRLGEAEESKENPRKEGKEVERQQGVRPSKWKGEKSTQSKCVCVCVGDEMHGLLTSQAWLGQTRVWVGHNGTHQHQNPKLHSFQRKDARRATLH